jgi:protein involved in polysaccharide export with SLBB domain
MKITYLLKIVLLVWVAMTGFSLSGFSVCILAQTTPTNDSNSSLEKLLRPMTANERGSNTVSRYFYPINPDLPLEGPINENEYICGPNDLFTISISTIDSQVQQIVPVTVEGLLILPGINPIRAEGRLLRDVKTAAVAALTAKLGPRSNAEVSLSQPRSFTVHISGGVANPGQQPVSPTTRLDLLVRAAINDLNPDQKTLAFRYRPSIRTIVITHTDGTKSYPDLARYFASGDLTYNPMLRQGDQIYIPSYNVYNEVLSIQGDVPYPGPYPHRADDHLTDLVEIAAGRTNITKIDLVRLTRYKEDGTTSYQNYNVRDILAGRAPDPPLQPRDMVFVPYRQRDNGTVSVEGDVIFPGAYPMTTNKTSVRELLNLAGGFRETAMPRLAYIERTRNQWDANSPFNIPQPSTTGLAATIDKARLGDLPLQSRIFLERELLMANRISVDLEALAQSNAPDIYLYDGDRLIIPNDQGKVMVIGEVVKRGLVNYVAGQKVDEYIQATGGKGINATQIYVIKSGSGQLFDAYKTDIQSGDIVFVDRKKTPDSRELQTLDMQERAFALSRTATIVSLITGTIALVISIIR